MSREWKVGDRFSTEGVVTALPDSDGDYRALFDGHTADGFVIAAEMAHAKFIKPKEKRKVWAKYYLVENACMVPIPPNLYMESIHGKIIGQKILEITEGDGMEDEQ